VFAHDPLRTCGFSRPTGPRMVAAPRPSMTGRHDGAGLGEDGPLARLDEDAVRRASGGGVTELLADRAAASWLGPQLQADEVARVVACLAHPDSATIHDQTIGVG
jgi:hypothetical protein